MSRAKGPWAIAILSESAPFFSQSMVTEDPWASATGQSWGKADMTRTAIVATWRRGDVATIQAAYVWDAAFVRMLHLVASPSCTTRPSGVSVTL